jgi:hypothetical protein
MVAYDDTVDLVFNHPKLDELEVTAREVDIGAYTRVLWLMSGGRNLLNDENMVHVGEMNEIVAASIASWNLDVPRSDPPEPLPVTAESLNGLPWRLRRHIIDAWIDAQVGLADPFEQPSNGGAPLAEIPATPLAS